MKTMIRLLSIAVLASWVALVTFEGSQAADALTDIRISFKLDPRLTQGLYMGNRWVSPPTYSRVGPAGGITIQAKAIGIDYQRKQRRIDAAWIIVDPELATVSRGRNSEVKITVHKEGESELLVNADNVSKKLTIKCESQNGGWHVKISR